jgi:prolyl 3-hydroxylase /prolyl 3,4-dihydroxylase
LLPCPAQAQASQCCPWQFAESEVYPHGVIDGLMDPEKFRVVRDEMIANLTSDFKETDLFKVFQTGDLANLDASDPEVVSTY